MPGLDDDPGDDEPVAPRPAPSERAWVHPAELQAFAAAPPRPSEPPRPREWVIGLTSAGAGVLVTVLVLVAFGALGGSERSSLPPPVVTAPDAPIDYAVAQRVASNAAPSIVTVSSDLVGADGKPLQGSGVVLRTDQVVTSAHLVTGAARLTVSTKDGDVLEARMLGVDPTTDLGLLLVEGVGPELPEPELVVEPAIGDTVVALGAGRSNEGWVDIGVVQERNWVASYAGGAVSVPGLIATGTNTVPATSGGGLFDENGRIIGILVSMPGDTRQGLAVPIDVALDVAEQLERDQAARHGALGVVFGADASDRRPGATVAGLVPDGPAAAAEKPLVPGDVITAVNRRSVRGWQDLVAAVRRLRPTEQVDLSVLRAGRSTTVAVQLGPAPDALDTPLGPIG